MDITGRKLAEEKLRRSEAYLAETQRLSHTGSWAWNIFSGDLFWSLEHFRIFGLDPQTTKPTYEGFYQTVHPDDRSRLRETFEQVVSNKAQFDGKYRIVRPDGTLRHIRSLANPVFNHAGEIVEYIGTVIDITERTQVEVALRESEARFRNYFELGLIGMAITSPAKGILEVNGELCRILGYEREELLQKTWAEMTHPDDLAADVAQFDRVLAGEIDGYTLDKQWIRKDGQVLDSIMSAKCLRRADGTVDFFVGLVLDITARKRAEQKLQRSEAHLAEAQRIGHVGSWIWNVATGQCLWSEENFCIFGLNAETFKPTKEKTLRLIHPEDLPFVEQTLERAVLDRSNFEVDARIVRPDGAIKYLHVSGRPIALQQGELEFIGTVVDVTERRQAEEALRKLQAELAHVTRVTAMGELAASIAHEINQPLGAIVNNCNVCRRLLRKPRVQKQIREVLTDIVQDITRASAIITRIRLLTKPSVRERNSLQLKQVVTDVLAVAQGELATRRITVQTDLAADLPHINGDRVQLQQVLFNLVINASDAMQTASVERRLLTITCRPHELDGRPAILLTVRDLGHGFKSPDTEPLFDAFYTTKAHGMGMGLRISRSIVEAHGGRLWANPNDGAGATFSCSFPVAT
ncbi:putative Histidine kinase [Verrucomicrobia bacterium]|nr:putative Histidine kinase [Verrucomicrobiota bacterium]